MRNPDRQTTFHFKHFSIKNTDSAMKVGTDAVLLGAWADCPQTPKRVLDVGCGTGVITLMAAQRWPKAEVLGLDIDPVAAREAAQNIAESEFDEWVQVAVGDFLQFESVTYDEDGKEEKVDFDLIVCNPPFFTETLQSPDTARAVARHEGTLTLPSLIRKAATLLSPLGALCIVMPESRCADIEMEAALAGLSVAEFCHVVTVEGKVPKRVLCRITKTTAPTLHNTLTIKTPNGEFTPVYRQLLKDFYLNF